MLRSQDWFDDSEDVIMSALYIERYMNWGISRDELQSSHPIIGIAQSGNDLVPCNRHHVQLADRVREGIRDQGGIPLEFPMHPLQETGKRPTAALDRNLAYLGLVEVLFGYPLDGVVLTTGCDKTTPAALMAAATVDIPAIVLSGGPMLNGWSGKRRVGSGSVVWDARKGVADGTLTAQEAVEYIASGSPSIGHCNTMGTALTMNSLAEVMGMSLPGCAAIPAPHRDRSQMAHETGARIVEMVHDDLRPSRILTRDSFLNAIKLTSALGGSSNAPIHLKAIAKHAGISLSLNDWQESGKDIPVLVDMQPAGSFLGEDFYRAGGVPALVSSLISREIIAGNTLTVTGKTLEENYAENTVKDTEVIRPWENPVKEIGGFDVLTGNIFDSAIIKLSAISDDFRKRYLSDSDSPNEFTVRAIVFEGPEDYNSKIDDPSLPLDENCILVIRGVGPIGYPGSAEVVNMRPSSSLLNSGIHELPCMGDGRQSGTSGAPSILNASPEAAANGGLSLLETGDMVRVNLNSRTVTALVSEEVWNARRHNLKQQGSFPVRPAQTPWQELHRSTASQLSEGMVMDFAVKYQQITKTWKVPRHNH